MAVKLYNPKQRKYYQDKGCVIIHRLRVFYKPDKTDQTRFMRIVDESYNPIGVAKVGFIKYGCEKGISFDNLLKDFLKETGFDSIKEWIEDIEKHDNYSQHAQYGAFYKIKKYVPGRG